MTARRLMRTRPYTARQPRRCVECGHAVRGSRRQTCTARCQYRLFARGAAQERARRRAA